MQVIVLRILGKMVFGVVGLLVISITGVIRWLRNGTYYIRISPTTTASCDNYSASSTSSTPVYNWDYDLEDWYWTPAQVAPPISIPDPFPAYSWPVERGILRPDVNALWRKPMRRTYRLHEEKRKGLRR